jgi:hypothetical protein
MVSPRSASKKKKKCQNTYILSHASLRCPGDNTIQACPSGTQSNVKGTVSQLDCHCVSGTFSSTSGCIPCPQNLWCVDNIKIECPPNMVSQAGTQSIAACTCPDAFFTNSIGECQECPVGFYCSARQKRACPSGASSLTRSLSVANCTCGNGFRPGASPGDPCQSCLSSQLCSPPVTVLETSFKIHVGCEYDLASIVDINAIRAQLVSTLGLPSWMLNENTRIILAKDGACTGASRRLLQQQASTTPTTQAWECLMRMNMVYIEPAEVVAVSQGLQTLVTTTDTSKESFRHMIAQSSSGRLTSSALTIVGGTAPPSFSTMQIEQTCDTSKGEIIQGSLCVCQKGYNGTWPTVPCSPCPRGTYKAGADISQCVDCGAFQTTDNTGAVEEAQCKCQSGFSSAATTRPLVCSSIAKKTTDSINLVVPITAGVGGLCLIVIVVLVVFFRGKTLSKKSLSNEGGSGSENGTTGTKALFSNMHINSKAATATTKASFAAPNPSRDIRPVPAPATLGNTKPTLKIF